MLIGLISDTHIPDHVRALPPKLEEVFRGVELILHAGDIYLPSVLDELELIAPVLAAEGDDDPFSIKNDPRVKWNQVINIDGVTIRLMHDKLWATVPFPQEASKNENHSPQVIVFGHTHSPSLQRKNGLLLVSPGSATFPNYKNELGTVGLLEIDSGKAEARIIQLQ
ncbi:MAG: YfcE family phosphodiesterase [Dehalococcoidales bacterium]|nr:YfcE family phosphodiesterase [Dehalococcoidales bacterium]